MHLLAATIAVFAAVERGKQLRATARSAVMMMTMTIAIKRG